MANALKIRRENASDIEAITDVTIAAFANLSISDQTEHLMVNALREAAALTLSLVAEIGDQLVGHIAFSPVSMSDGTTDWYGLGPVSVLPDYQKRRIGSALIEQGLEMLEQINAKGCILAGHPEYYPRFGFINPESLFIKNVPPQACFVLAFTDQIPTGEAIFHDALSSNS